MMPDQHGEHGDRAVIELNGAERVRKRLPNANKSID